MDGLTAYYDMKGDANDIIGGNNGTVSGATLTTDYFGNSNSAYDFDGTNDQITGSGIALTSAYFIQGMVKFDTTGQDKTVFRLHQSGTSILYLIVYNTAAPSGPYHWYVYHSGG